MRAQNAVHQEGRRKMEKSKVYFTNMKAKIGENLQMKLNRLMKKAGM